VSSPSAPPVLDDSAATLSQNVLLPRHPAPPLRAPASSVDEPVESLRPTNILTRLLNKEDPPTLTREQVEGYLRDNHRNAESLLGAFHATRVKSLLQEAKDKFPTDPHVELVAATQSDTPEERRQWIDALKQSAPGNAMANYLSAADYFKSGKNDMALQEIQVAGLKPLQDYQLEFLQNDQEAYRAAGYSEADARSLAALNLLLPDLGAYKNVGYSLVDLANSYRQANDTASAQAALQLALDLSQRVNVPGSLTLVQSMVGLAIEQKALGTMDPNAQFGGANQTVQNQLDAIQQQRDAIKALNQQWTTLVPRMSDQDLANFFQRESSFGELAAEQWAVNKFAPPAASGQP
jgi:tetratricopeptide (TPR) repeat protein